MEKDPNEICLNGIEYIRKDSIKIEQAKSPEGLPYVLIRTYSAGVHVGYLASRHGKEVKLINTRRIWYWAGANSLSQLALEGSKKPSECKFSVEISYIELMEAIEVIPVTEAAEKNIKSIVIWKQ
jgi:hypothetical protein